MVHTATGLVRRTEAPSASPCSTTATWDSSSPERRSCSSIRTVVESTTADGNGQARADVLPGASVTAFTGPHRLTTTLGLAPGDDLIIGNAPTPPATQLGSFTIRWEPLGGHPLNYEVYGPCEFSPAPAGQSSVTVDFTNACHPDGGEVLVTTADGIARVSTELAGIRLVDGGSATLPATWIPNLTFTASYTNLTAIRHIELERRVPDDGYSSTLQRDVTGLAAIDVDLDGPPGATSRIETTIMSDTGGTQYVRQLVPGNVAASPFDASELLLPWLATPTVDAAARRVELPHVAVGTSQAIGDLLEVNLAWPQDDGIYQWRLFGPDTAAVEIPVLPAALGVTLPPTPGNRLIAYATLYEADAFAGYDDVRGNIHVAIVKTIVGPRSPAQTIRWVASDPFVFSGVDGR